MSFQDPPAWVFETYAHGVVDEDVLPFATVAVPQYDGTVTQVPGYWGVVSEATASIVIVTEFPGYYAVVKNGVE